MIRRFRTLTALAVFLLCIAFTAAHADPVGTAFTFQGYLEKDAVPYSGTAEFELRLYDAPAGGAQVGPTATHSGVPVTQGLFTIGLDFGAVFDGNQRWLEVATQTPGDAGFTTFGGRIEVQGSPYALWSANGGGGGGSLTLPFSGSANAVGTTSSIDPLQGTAAVRFDNLANAGMSYGITGTTLSNRMFTGGVLGIALATSGYTSGLVGEASSSPNGRGVTGLGSEFGGYFTPMGLTGHGVGGFSTEGNAVRARSTSGTGVDAASNSGTAIFGESTTGWGIWGVSHAGGSNAVFGQTYGTNGNGVIGRNEAATGAGVFGYSPYGATGVLAVAEQGDGLSARTNAAGKNAVFAYAGAANAYGGFFTGVAGSTPLKVDGTAEVRTLKILGADLAENFPVREHALEPGTVLMLDDGGAPGRLRTCDESYSHRVAGVVSGANGLDAAVVLSGEAFDAEGHATVALSGRVWVKCDASNGAIRPGDLLTSAPRAGHAMRADDRDRAYGATLGKAMTSLETGTGLVLVLVNLQ